MTMELFGLVAEKKPLVGKACAVPRFCGRGRWWTTIIDQSPCGKYIRVKLGGAQGRSPWIAVKDAMEIRDKKGRFDL
jgi:hypothetical protein